MRTSLYLKIIVHIPTFVIENATVLKGQDARFSFLHTLEVMANFETFEVLYDDLR